MTPSETAGDDSRRPGATVCAGGAPALGGPKNQLTKSSARRESRGPDSEDGALPFQAKKSGVDPRASHGIGGAGCHGGVCVGSVGGRYGCVAAPHRLAGSESQ
jgi:hypothetical protein